ncbi:AAA family ATPase [Nocardia sp. XZ_19_369]|uniref:AAA family ATPase n=1 Tax=Nocardia sp. XZ_19_369 TaxID=2769487 RepID=UPI00188FE062|nr:AAA family ATPase [Nocardia sp. XZ_19_369]
MLDHRLFESIEGLPGTGKSTIAPLLAEARQAVLVPTVPPCYQPLRRELDLYDNADARMCFFLSALFTASDQIGRYLDAGTPVVVESYFARCLTSHSVFGAKLELALPQDLPQPVTYQLTCEPSARLARLGERDKPMTRWDVLGERRTDQLAAAYRRFPVHPVDTTNSTPDEVVRTILSLNVAGANRVNH